MATKLYKNEEAALNSEIRRINGMHIDKRTKARMVKEARTKANRDHYENMGFSSRICASTYDTFDEEFDVMHQIEKYGFVGAIKL